MSIESDCQKDCEQLFKGKDSKSLHKCVKGCHGELVGKGLWDKALANPGRTRYQEVFDEAYFEALREGASKREAEEYAQEVVRAASDDDANALGGARGEDSLYSPFYANPTNAQWGWIVGGAVVAGVAWLLYRARASTPAWSCQKGHNCVNYDGTKTWHDDDPVSKSLKIYDTPPANLAELEVKKKLPDYTIYTLPESKQGVGMCWLP